jgi:hypothetical protein
MRKPPRIFIGFGETSGYCAGLKKGFDEIGVPAFSFIISDHLGRFENASQGRLLSAIRAILKKRGDWQARSKKSRNLLTKLTCALARMVLALAQNAVWLAVILWVLAKFDVFVLQGRSSFINYFRFPIRPRFMDLPILKLFGKKIFYVFHGTDTRPAYINGRAGICELNAKQLARYARRQAEDVRAIEKYADFILHYPLNTHFHRKRIISHEYVGRPVFVAASSPQELRTTSDSVRIVHAPSDPVGKGTEKIRECIKNLRQKGHQIEFIELVDKTNDEVKEELRRCDFLVDQVYYDVAISYVGTEAAFLGKPSVCGTYAAEALRQSTPASQLPPVFLCAPQDLEQAIETMITNRALRQRLGEQARRFVTAHYGPARVAQNYLRLIANDAPDEWRFNPNSVSYCHGYGYSEERVKEVIRSVVQTAGESALSLEDKPALKEKFLRFAFEEPAA